MIEPGFLTPRMVMQVCVASMMTAAPLASSFSISRSAIWLVSRSCTCGRRAKMLHHAGELAEADDLAAAAGTPRAPCP